MADGWEKEKKAEKETAREDKEEMEEIHERMRGPPQVFADPLLVNSQFNTFAINS